MPSCVRALPVPLCFVLATAVPAGIALAQQAGGQELSLREFQPTSMLRVTTHDVPRARYPVVDVHNHVSNMPVDELRAVMAASNVMCRRPDPMTDAPQT